MQAFGSYGEADTAAVWAVARTAWAVCRVRFAAACIVLGAALAVLSAVLAAWSAVLMVRLEVCSAVFTAPRGGCETLFDADGPFPGTICS